MFAINHSATALIIKKKYPDVSMIWLLISVNLMELFWVLLNYLGIEHLSTENVITYIGDVHLYDIPFSHSIFVPAIISIAAWLIIAKGFKKQDIGIAVGLGIISHLILDLATHCNEIVIAPYINIPLCNFSLYYSFPVMSFFVELIYSIICWCVYKGSKSLLVILVLCNVANFSFFKVVIPGIGTFLAHQQIMITTIILIQILYSSIFIYIFSKKGNSK